jgi:hypothetical protein
VFLNAGNGIEQTVYFCKRFRRNNGRWRIIKSKSSFSWKQTQVISIEIKKQARDDSVEASRSGRKDCT